MGCDAEGKKENVGCIVKVFDTGFPALILWSFYATFFVSS